MASMAAGGRIDPVDGTRAGGHTDGQQDILDARSAVETKIAALAASRRTDEDLERIEDALRAMGEDVAASGDSPEDAERFHAAVAAAAHSPVLARMRDQIADVGGEAWSKALGKEGHPEKILESLRAIVEAIRAQDSDGAAHAMAEHIERAPGVARRSP